MTADAVPTPQELVARAKALAPCLAERAERCEAARRCPDETIAELDAAGLLRICRPARWGGWEHGWDVLCEASRALARGCGAQAWVANILNDHAQLLGMFPLEAQDEVWGRDRGARISASVEPVGRAKPVSGGVVFSGRHRYSSGIDHAQWVALGGHVEREGAPPRRCYVIVPRGEGTIIDDWHVVGLAGTGSKGFALDGVFVPEHRILDGEAHDNGTGPGSRAHPAPVFRMPRTAVAATAFAAIAVGIAEAFLESFLDYTKERKSRGVAIAGLGGTQIDAGAAAADIEAAARMCLGAAREAMATLARGETLSQRQKLATKLAASFAGQRTLAAAQRLFNAAGGRALFTDNAMQRHIRDLYAVAAHHALVWNDAAGNFGAHLLGLER